jgi:hypothetical protein
LREREKSKSRFRYHHPTAQTNLILQLRRWMSLIPSIPNAGTSSPARKQLLCSCCPSPSRHVELTTTRRGNKGDTIIFCVSDRVLALVHDCRHSDEIHGGGAAVQPKEWQSGSVLASDEGRIEGTKQDMGAQRTNPITACRCHFRPGIAFTPTH